MLRKTGLLFIFAFLAMQVMSSMHMAEHAFKKHEHNGRTCQVYLNAEQAKHASGNVIVSLSTPYYVIISMTLPELVLTGSTSYSAAIPRAPPVFS